MFERFSDAARQAVGFAQSEAHDLGHAQIGTEHLLLGLLRVDEGAAAGVLERLGITPERARAVVRPIQGAGAEPGAGQLPFTSGSKRAFERALREALVMGGNTIGTEHLLLAIVREPEAVVTRLLAELAVDVERVRDEVIVAARSGRPPRPLPPVRLRTLRARMRPSAAAVLDWTHATTLWRPDGLELRVPLSLSDGAIATFAADAAWSAEPLSGLHHEIWKGWLALAGPGLLDVDPAALRRALDAAAKRAGDVGGRERGRVEDFLRRLAEDP